MPIYEYYCKKCKKNIEILQKEFKNKEECECSEKGKLKRLISNTSFALTGKGFYKTDYK
jgi:putative FmdB family regulatory protein